MTAAILGLTLDQDKALARVLLAWGPCTPSHLSWWKNSQKSRYATKSKSIMDLRLVASSLYLAVASDEPRGATTIWDTRLFEELEAFCLDEHTLSLVFDSSGSLVACYFLSATFQSKVPD